MNFRISKSTLFFACAVAALLASCGKRDPPSSADGEQSAPATEVKVVDVDAAAAAKLLKEGTAKALDVRTKGEYDLGHIADAVLVDIQSEGFEESVATLDHAKPYIVHCAAGVDGGRSRRAVDALKADGATTVYHLTGGFIAWQQDGQAVEK